jgi:hypothetical protein
MRYFVRSDGLPMDALLGAVKFLGLNGLTGVAALALASRCRLSSRAERLLAASVLYVGLALASGLLLGLTGHLTYWWVTVLQAGIAVVAGVGARWQVTRDAVDLRRWPGLVTGRGLRIAALAVGVAYLYVAFVGVVSEPSAGDELMYHLPLVAAFARAGRIVVPALGTYWHTDWWAYHPANAYVLYQWWVLPFGSGVVVDLVQLPHAIAAALATFVIARGFGADRRGALWAALLFLAVPIVINQCKTGLVDVTLTFLFAAGIAFAVCGTPTRQRLLLAALAWGAVPGGKLSGIVYLAAGGACLLLHAASTLRGRALLRQLAVAAAAIGSATLLLSGYWFARNYWLKGSPIFPLSVVDAQNMAWSNVLVYGPLIPLLDFTIYHPMFFYNYETGAGLQFAALALPAAAALAFGALRRRQFGVAATAALPLLMYPFWLVSHSREPHTLFRFVLPAMPAGFAAAGWFLSRAPRARVVTGAALVAVVFSVVNAVPHVGTFLRPDSMRAGIAQLMLGTRRLGRFDQMGDLATQDYRRAWHYLDQLPGAHNIAARHLVFSYPMLGADFRHRLYFFDATERSDWLAAVHAASVDHVVLTQMVDPDARISTNEGLRLLMPAWVTSDEHVAALHALPERSIRGVRIRYEVPSPDNVRVLLGLNRFAETFALPLDRPATHREHTIEWTGVAGSVELLLAFVPRTRLREDVELRVATLELLGDDGPVPIPLAAPQWSRATWPLEYYWMESDPRRFRLAFRDQDYWLHSSSGELRVYAVADGGE